MKTNDFELKNGESNWINFITKKKAGKKKTSFL